VRGYRSNPLLAVVGNPGPSRRAPRPQALTPVVNANTGEVRGYALNPHEATQAALAEDLGYVSGIPTAELCGGSHVRTGPWCAQAAGMRRNGKRAPRSSAGRSAARWAQILDVIHYARQELTGQQPRGVGIASITRQQWLDRFHRPPKKQGKQNKDMAWRKLNDFIDAQDARGAGLRALAAPGWLHLSINNVYDAAWVAQPGSIHQLGEEREREVLGRSYEGFELEGRLADRADFWSDFGSRYSADDPEEFAFPGGSQESYQEILAQERVLRTGHELAPGEGSGRLAGEETYAANPQEKTAKRPKEVEVDLWEYEDLPGFDASWDHFKDFHESEPTRMVIFEIEDGSDEEHWEPVHSYLHDVIETNYTVPNTMTESNKHQGGNPDLYPGHPQSDPGLWKHKHFSGTRGGRRVDLPVEARHPFTMTTRKVLRGTALDRWWES